MSDTDIEIMHKALALAATNLGQTWPNPAVGAIVVKDGKIIGEGFTARGGRPHAEPQALKQAGDKAKGATLYVTFEPCAHHGKTPPCTDAIINAGIARVVIACGDPAPHVNGKGAATLRKAGIEVVEGVCEEEARLLNRGFLSVVEKKRPYIALKIATSADDKIAGGKDRWITGEASRQEVHRLRSQYDAILTGIGTVLADDPMLNVRIVGLEDRSPVRVILDRHNRLPDKSQIAQTTNKYTSWVLSTPTLEETLEQLAEKGITRLLVEAGKTLNTAFLLSNVVDRVYWFKSPDSIGNKGLDAADGGLYTLANWHKVDHTALPPDTLDILEPCLPVS
ncbi:MAG: bifunctional diaminohydroxyphosphoribosylaminopyrimidine deaminase/5-amino-6-(5-phosphoribosylamino)uracil reductase RibD [Rickettsiales bacterium]